MGTGDDQRVEGTGGAVILGPAFLHARGIANEDGFHHAGVVVVAGIQGVDAVEGAGSCGVKAAPERTSTAPGFNGDVRCHASGRRPIDTLAGKKAGIVEGAGIVETDEVSRADCITRGAAGEMFGDV